MNKRLYFSFISIFIKACQLILNLFNDLMIFKNNQDILFQHHFNYSFFLKLKLKQYHCDHHAGSSHWGISKSAFLIFCSPCWMVYLAQYPDLDCRTYKSLMTLIYGLSFFNQLFFKTGNFTINIYGWDILKGLFTYLEISACSTFTDANIS